MGENTKRVTLPVKDGNTEIATVDGVSLHRGDPNPKDLTDEQIQRLQDAGAELEILEPEEDPLDKIKTHADADAALAAESLSAPAGTNVEGKVQLLKDARDNEDDN